MDSQELNACREAYIENLTLIVKEYDGRSRKSKYISLFVAYACIVGFYFLFFDLLGGMLGYTLFAIFLVVIICCVDAFWIPVKNAPLSDQKLAYRACLIMEALIKIKQDAHSSHECNVSTVGLGNHIALYEQFIEFFPELASRKLKQLARLEVSHAGICE